MLHQINPVHVPIPLPEGLFSIILPSIPGTPKQFFPSGLHTTTLHAPLLFPICAACPAHPILQVQSQEQNFNNLSYMIIFITILLLLRNESSSSLMFPLVKPFSWFESYILFQNSLPYIRLAVLRNMLTPEAFAR